MRFQGKFFQEILSSRVARHANLIRYAKHIAEPLARTICKYHYYIRIHVGMCGQFASQPQLVFAALVNLAGMSYNRQLSRHLKRTCVWQDELCVFTRSRSNGFTDVATVRVHQRANYTNLSNLFSTAINSLGSSHSSAYIVDFSST